MISTRYAKILGDKKESQIESFELRRGAAPVGRQVKPHAKNRRDRTSDQGSPNKLAGLACKRVTPTVLRKSRAR